MTWFRWGWKRKDQPVSYQRSQESLERERLFNHHANEFERDLQRLKLQRSLYFQDASRKGSAMADDDKGKSLKFEWFVRHNGTVCARFVDHYGETCDIRMDRLVPGALWFGRPMHPGFHLSRKQVRDLLPLLTRFTETGEWGPEPEPEPEPTKSVTWLILDRLNRQIEEIYRRLEALEPGQ